MAKFQSLKYSYCLFASLYKDYEDNKNSEKYLPMNGLPCPMTYEIPSDFYHRFGPTQVEVNRIFSDYCKPIFEELPRETIKDTSSFLGFCYQACVDLSPHLPPPLMVLGFCAIVSQLNLYCFQNGCFRFAEVAPRCLDSIFTKSVYLRIFIMHDKEKVRGYIRLRNYIRKIVREGITDTVKRMGECFFKTECKRIKDCSKKLQQLKFKGDPKITKDVSEDSDISNDEDVPSVEDTVVKDLTTGDECSICKEHNCVKYLEKFVTVFKDEYETKEVTMLVE